MLFLAVLLSAIAICWDGRDEAATSTLPRLNYWALMDQLVHKRALPISLGVSASQLAQVKDLRVQDKFEDMFDEVLHLQIAEKRFTSTEKVWLELDPRIYDELRQVLTEKQISSLRQLVLRSPYLGPLDCYKDAELLKYMEWQSQPESFSIALEEERVKFEWSVQQLKKECLSEIFAALPPPSSDRLQRYSGPVEYSRLNKIEDIDSIPYSVTTLFEGLYFASKSTAIPDALALSTSQKSELKSIYLASGKGLPMTASQQERKETDAQSAAKMRQVLRREQYAFLVPLAARNQLCQDFRREFKRKEFLDFLQLEPEDIAPAQDAAEKQTRRMNLELERLSEAAFQNVANTLPAKPRAKLLALFDGGWAYKHR